MVYGDLKTVHDFCTSAVQWVLLTLQWGGGGAEGLQHASYLCLQEACKVQACPCIGGLCGTSGPMWYSRDGAWATHWGPTRVWHRRRGLKGQCAACHASLGYAVLWYVAVGPGDPSHLEVVQTWPGGLTALSYGRCRKCGSHSNFARQGAVTREAPFKC